MKAYLGILKSNIMYIIISVLLISVTLLLFVKKEVDLVVISRDYPYSIYHSDVQEKIGIEILTNKQESYHFSKQYIIDSKIYNDSDELSVLVNDIRVSNNYIRYNDEKYYQVIFNLALPFNSNDLQISIEEAYLEITYDNMEKLNIRIGDFVYLFDKAYGDDMTLGNLSATHEVINGYNTIGGINLELANNSEYNIMITDVKLLSNSVYFNKELISKYINCAFDTSVQSCLGVETYNFNEMFKDTSLNILLGKNNEIELYLPLLYDPEFNFIYEFGIVITYEINNQKKIFIIDDFPYMKTSIFNDFYEEDFHVYTISD